jgi:hypothetical protein
MDKPNRAERRRNKFGGVRATEHGGWPTFEPNPVLRAGESPEATAETAADDPKAKGAKAADSSVKPGEAKASDSEKG